MESDFCDVNFGFLGCCKNIGHRTKAYNTQKNPQGKEEYPTPRVPEKYTDNQKVCGIGVCFLINTYGEIVVDAIVPEG